MIVVTGVAGFIGSNALTYLVRKYPHRQYIGIDKLNYASDNSTKYIDRLIENEGVTFIELDLAENLNGLREVFKNYYIELVIDFAAESSVDRSYRDPLYFTTNNILSSQNLLECIKEQNGSRSTESYIKFINVSTDEVYGQLDTSIGASEASSLNPTNPYSATKAAVDLIANAYASSFKVPIVTTRACNIYGPNQYPEKLIPMTIEALEKGKKITIHGDGHHRRCYLHVEDFCRALDLIVHKGAINEIYNVGTSDEMDNLGLVELIYQLKMEGTIDYDKQVEFVPDRLFNDSGYRMNLSKINALGWHPQIKLRDGLARLINLGTGSPSSQTRAI